MEEQLSRTIGFIRMGLINTLFRDIEELKKNFGLFFGDADITISGNIVNIKSKPEFKPYSRAFRIAYIKSNDSVYPYKLIKIEEVC